MTVPETNAIATRDDTALVPIDREQAASALEHLLATGDLSAFSPKQRIGYYLHFCNRAGLASEGRPFDWLTLDGRLVLYPNKSCAEQLRRQHQISVKLTRRDIVGDMFVVEVEGSRPNGQTDFASKYVPLRDGRGNRLVGRDLANAYAKAECVPLDSEILTRDGWRAYDQIAVGQDVLAYDLEQDRCRWTPLQAVTVYEEALTVRIGSPSRLGFRCTPDHSWAVMHRPYQERRRGEGRPGPRGPYATRRPLRELMDATRMSGADGIILAAPAESGSHPLSAHEAAILGWIMTDGNIQHRASHVRCTIYQSKPDRIEEIEQLVAASGYTPSRVSLPAVTRDFTGIGRYGGGVSECLPQRRWVFSAYESRALLAKAGIEQTTDLIGLVTRLSSEARAAMLAAMMAGDGDSRGRFGTKTKLGVMEAWEILATLQGRALGNLSGEDRDVRVRRLRKTRRLHGGRGRLMISDPAVEAVWCPTTAYGTWVMRQNNQITITGNTGAKRRLTFSMIGLGALPDLEEVQKVRYVVVDGEGNVVEKPTDEQRYLAENPQAARHLGEPTFETTATPADAPDIAAGPSQAVRPEELERPKRVVPRQSFRPSEEDVKRLLGAWFAAVQGSSLDDDDARHRAIALWTVRAGWPKAKQTDSLKTAFGRMTEREASDFLAHIRAIVEDERAGSGEAVTDIQGAEAPREANEEPF